MLKDIIVEKWKESYKNKDVVLKSAYECVKAKILVEEKSGKHSLPLTDAVVENIIIKEVKELKETQSYYKVEDQMYLDIERKIQALSEYLPKQMTVDEVKAVILAMKEKESNPGKLTGMVVKEIGSRFDKSQISMLVKEVLSQ